MGFGRFGVLLNTILENRRWRQCIAYTGILLDIGCRDGRFVRQLNDGIGIDIDDTKNNKLKYKDGMFDTVTMFAVVEHIKKSDMIELQKEIDRVLSEVYLSYLVITTPTRFAHPLLYILSVLGLIPRKDIKEHVSYYNKWNILDVFTCFDLVHYKRFDIFNQRFLLCKK